MASLEELIAHQEQAMNTIHRILPNFKKLGKPKWTLAIAQNRHRQLKDTFAKCESFDAKIHMLATEALRASLPYFVSLQFFQCEEAFNEASDFLAEVIHSFETSRVAQSTIATASSASRPPGQLPQIQLPSFNGTLTTWENYRDQFQSLIHHDKTITLCDKMHYLKSSLKGDALRTVGHLPVTASNYDIAWQILISRYENKRRLVTKHIRDFLNLPSIKTESLSTLQNLRDTTNSSLQALRNLDRPVDAWPDVIILIICSKFDPKTRQAWETRFGDSQEFPNYNDLDKFLESRIQILEALHDDNHALDTQSFKLTARGPRPKHLVANYTQSSDLNRRTDRTSSNSSPLTPFTCPVCNECHPLHRCERFLSHSITQRLETVERYRLCHNCLSANHSVSQCFSRYHCRICLQRHHTLIHQQSNERIASTDPTPQVEGAISSNQLISSLPPSVLLATARVRVASSNGRCAIIRALLDQGSTATLISESLAQTLRAPRRKCTLRIAGINGGESIARSTTTITISPSDVPTPTYTIQSIVLPSLTRYTATRLNSPSSWDHTRTLRLSDTDPFSTDPIDLVIGADLYGQVLRAGTIVGKPHEPTAQNTIFGWILSGIVSSPAESEVVSSLNVTLLEDLDAQIRKFWEVEDIPSTTELTPSERECEEHFKATHSRNEQGRYIVRLPFVLNTAPNLGDSKHHALTNFRRLETRLSKNTEHRTAYHEFMRDYETLGHMTKVLPTTCTPAQPYYIPHHAVLRDSSSTTQLRVVFNASAITTNGKSLNDCLLIGQKLQSDLSSVILRWRLYQFVLTSDIAKMYRQILIHPLDADYQRILWRSSSTDTVDTYQLRTVTYGTASAPFLALRVLNQLITDEGSEFPLAVSVLRQHTYVDDCIFGAETLAAAEDTKEQLISLLGRGGFRLRKWASNSPQLLQDIDPTDHGLAKDKALNPDESLRVLGISWHPEQDILHFQLSLPTIPGETKRAILSTISRFYDPLGWLAPVIIMAKIFIQQLWAFKCEWDEIVPTHIRTCWRDYYEELPLLKQVIIPRWTGFSSDSNTCELHAFADASSKAYAAAIYMRCLPSSGPIITTLLIAKSKVAPLKTISIPRLELCAATLLAKLLHAVRSELPLQPCATYCWTDSTIVLAWLRQPPTKWKTFVANRVSLIQTLTATAIWRHVATQDNPADCASRGILPTELLHHELWWSGPSWLMQDESAWPQTDASCRPGVDLEERSLTVHSATIAPPVWDLQDRFSSWSKLLRITALIQRFIYQLRKRAKLHNIPRSSTSLSHPDYLNHEEITAARQYWLRSMQQDIFHSEIDALKTKGLVKSSSSILSLNPYLDSDGLLRVGGRLRHANLSASRRHPIILRSHPLLHLLIQQHHMTTLHGGVQLTLVSLRSEYWILRARQSIRAVIHRCIVCTRERATIPAELMSDLPHTRVTRTTRAFQHTGVDYAGPIAVRTTPGRGHKSHKAYIALFICLSVKAVHIELVSDYSSATFIAAYHRFVSRRGTPTAMYSDNGSNFHGASKELRTAYLNVTRDGNWQTHLATTGVQWHFSPPSAPHFGGLWEAGVKSTKHHLRRCIGNHTLTFEELTTLLARIEACLNSRPIAPISDNADDYTALTPEHFLIGTPLFTPPEPSVLDLSENRLSRWQLLQRTTEQFWKAWSSDYLQTLQQRPKWRQVQGLAKVGRIVLVRNDNAPPCQWELGRITACHPGPDGLIRVVTIQTSKSEYVRSIVKVCFLPVDINEEVSSSDGMADSAPATTVNDPPS